MKKITKPFLIISLVVVFLIFSFIIAFFSLSDKITNLEKKSVGKSIILRHETEKEDYIDTNISMTSNSIGEYLYLIQVNFDNQSDSGKYNIKNGNFQISMGIDVEALMMFYSAGGSNYFIPNVRYSDEQKILECSSDNGYLCLYLLLSGEEAEDLKFTVNYSIIGNGIYFLNKFYGFSETFTLNDFD